MLASASLLSSPENRLHRLFVDQLMPKVERHAEIYFRGVNCPTKRADKAAECVALAWRWFVRREERGKNVFEFPMAFCVLVAKAVHRAGVSVDVDGQHGSVRVCFGSELLRCLFYQRC